MKPFQALCITCFMLCSCAEPVQTSTYYVFGTTVELTLYGVSPGQSDTLSKEVEAQLQSMHHRWHAWRDNELAAIHRACQTHETLTVSDDVLRLIEQGQILSQASEGYFNPAMGELLALWGFLSDQANTPRPLPDAQALQAWVDAPASMDALTLEGHDLTCDNPHLRLDFGAYAKGYGMGQIMDYLKSQGVQTALLNAGGDVLVMGSQKHRPWRVAIRSPRGEGPSAIVTSHGNESIFTSGTYERVFVDEHDQTRRYHHVINPKTGYPSTDFISVTVIHADPTRADAAATALLAAPREAWAGLAESMGIEMAYLVTETGEILTTKAMRKRVQ